MISLNRTAAALGLALLAVVVPAAAPALAVAPPKHTPVPAGELEHTVTDLFYPAATNSAHHDTVRNERWMTATAGRELETNITSHRQHSDCQFQLGAMSRCWTPTAPGHPGIIHLNPGSPFLLTSWIDQGRDAKYALDHSNGTLHVTGKTTFLGRPAITVEADPQPTSQGGTVTSSEILDARTYYPLRQETKIVGDPAPKGSSGTYRLDEVIQVKVMKVISPRGVRLTMSPHPGARVVDDIKNAKRKHKH